MIFESVVISSTVIIRHQLQKCKPRSVTQRSPSPIHDWSFPMICHALSTTNFPMKILKAPYNCSTLAENHQECISTASELGRKPRTNALILNGSPHINGTWYNALPHHWKLQTSWTTPSSGVSLYALQTTFNQNETAISMIFSVKQDADIWWRVEKIRKWLLLLVTPNPGLGTVTVHLKKLRATRLYTEISFVLRDLLWFWLASVTLPVHFDSTIKKMESQVDFNSLSKPTVLTNFQEWIYTYIFPQVCVHIMKDESIEQERGNGKSSVKTVHHTC